MYLFKFYVKNKTSQNISYSHINRSDYDASKSQPLGKKLCIYHRGCSAHHFLNSWNYSDIWAFRVMAYDLRQTR
jgi:hypothetical protein